MKRSMYQIEGNEEVFIIELKIYPDCSGWSVYSLYVDSERPVYFDSRPIIFFDIESAKNALSFANCGAEKLHKVAEEVVVFDFYSAIQMLKDPLVLEDDNDNLLSCLNLIEDFFFDTRDNIWDDPKQFDNNFVDDRKHKIPISSNSIAAKYDNLKKIYSASFYFFNHTNIDGYFTEQGYKREDLISAIYQVIGEISMSAVIIQ